LYNKLKGRYDEKNRGGPPQKTEEEEFQEGKEQ